MAKETFKAMRERIMSTLKDRGWTLSGALKVPYATSPDGRIRLWFKPQAIHLSEGNHHTLGNARSLYDDARGESVGNLLTSVQRYVNAR